MTRVLLAGIFHETHCFLDRPTRLEDFTVERGDAVLAHRGRGSQIDGFLEEADAAGWTVVPAAAYTATPSGMVEHRVVEAFIDDLGQVLASYPAPDAIFLSLHGAMVTDGCDDVEGMLIDWLRRQPGCETVPLFGVFDLHANFSPAMAAGANGLLCYRENPHTDARETGVRAARLLRRSLEAGQVPTMVHRAPGIIWAPPGTGTADLPMRRLEQLARQIEAENADIWAVNVVAGFSFADTPDTGVCFSVISTAPAAINAAALAQLCAKATEIRDLGTVIETTPDEALDRILASPRGKGPALIVEPSDNIGAGAPGNGTGVLRALLARGVGNAAVALWDPEAVDALWEIKPGSTVRASVGGKNNRFDAGPVALDVVVVSRSDGHFTLEDIHSHLAASRGRDIEMGRCVVVRHGGITILLTSERTPPFDLGQWRSQGIAPETLDVIGVKAAVAHRRAYDPIMSASYTVATPGACSSDPGQMPYSKVPRPIFPLDRPETALSARYPDAPHLPRSHLPFSPVVEAGGLLYISGQASVDHSGKIIDDDFEGEMRRSIENLAAILVAVGSGLDRVVQTRNYVRDPADLPAYNRIYRDYFRAPLPARTTITNCLSGTLKYEIEAVALAPAAD